MKQEIFTIYDSKAEAFLTPFFLPAIGMAIRTFTECANSNDHQFSRHAADYTLFHVGTFHDENASIEMMETKRNLGTALEHKHPDMQPDLFKKAPNASTAPSIEETLINGENNEQA